MDPVAIATAPNLSDQVRNIPMLIGTDFGMWKVSVEIVVGCMELDLALRTERPTSTPEDPNEAEIEKWDRSNEMCLMVMRRSIPEAFWGLVEKENARKFLDEIEPYFDKNDNPEATKLFADLISMTYDGKGSIEEYIIGMFHLAMELKSLKLELSENLLVNLILASLPARFEQLKTCYNTRIYQWSMDELLSRCVVEEEVQLLFSTTGNSHSTISEKLHKILARQFEEREIQCFDTRETADSMTVPALHKENTEDNTEKCYEEKNLTFAMIRDIEEVFPVKKGYSSISCLH